MKYDIKDSVYNEYKGFYTWNKPTFLINKADDRYNDFINIKKDQGFSPDEIWSLRTNIALFLLPRLKYFKEYNVSYPANLNSINEWIEILNKIILAFSSVLKDDSYIPEKYLDQYNENITLARKKYNEDIKEGLKLFSEYFFDLWS